MKVKFLALALLTCLAGCGPKPAERAPGEAEMPIRYGPDSHGVVCYREMYPGYSIALSCVKVTP